MTRRGASRRPVITPARHTAAIEAWIMVALILSALSTALIGPSPTSAIVDLPLVVQASMAGVVAFGATICLIGLRLRDEILAAFFELAGLIGVTGPLAVWVLNAAFNVSNPTSSFGAMILALIWTAFIHRAWQVWRWLRWLMKPLRKDGASK